MNLNRIISTVILMVFAVASCSHHYSPIASIPTQLHKIDPESLVGKKVRFHLADGSTEQFTVTEVEHPYIRGNVSVFERNKFQNRVRVRYPRQVDLREVTAVEVETIDTRKTAHIYYLVGVGVVMVSVVGLYLAFSSME